MTQVCTHVFFSRGDLFLLTLKNHIPPLHNVNKNLPFFLPCFNVLGITILSVLLLIVASNNMKKRVFLLTLLRSRIGLFQRQQENIGWCGGSGYAKDGGASRWSRGRSRGMEQGWWCERRGKRGSRS